MTAERKTTVARQKIEASPSDIEWIKENITSISKKVQEVSNSLEKLNQTVVGDKVYGQEGLVAKVKEHNDYIEKDKQYKSKMIGAGVVITFIWGMLLKLWKI